MKKIIRISLAVLSVLVIGTMFSSCSDVKPSSETVAYVVEGSVSGGLLASFVVANFQAAIHGAVGSGYVKPNDAKVISACDNYYNQIKSDKTLEGSVKILKKPYSGGSGSVIKEYTFKKQ